ncbi:hypothetical protein HN51_049798 [Arachis hypogaea]|uniref:Glycine-rich protein n=1 Tax=Arachis hypogaea TaxID=3818 RepID=A0A444YDY1_ARAHY|nr:glycine-rich protein 3 short isoform-like [Arachis hypogaea]RYR00109.1 hypothetical protein Ahy_B07g088187 [Arachis hypogaea]
MCSRVAILMLGLLAMVLLISSEVAARNLAEKVDKEKNRLGDAKYGGGGYPGYGHNGGGGSPGSHHGGSRYPGHGGGGYCRYGCCGSGYGGRCRRCCSYAGEHTLRSQGNQDLFKAYSTHEHAF